MPIDNTPAATEPLQTGGAVEYTGPTSPYPSGAPPKVRKPGRRTKLTDDLIDKICVLVRAGNYVETAAAYAGVHKETLYQWFRRGASSRRGIYRRFADAVLKATAEAELRDLQIIASAAANGQWQAAAWRLERRVPLRWGRRDFVQAQHVGPDGGPIQVEGGELPFKLERVREAYLELLRREIEMREHPLKDGDGSEVQKQPDYEAGGTGPGHSSC